VFGAPFETVVAPSRVFPEAIPNVLPVPVTNVDRAEIGTGADALGESLRLQNELFVDDLPSLLGRRCAESPVV
jgi:hypothetical protein